MKWFEVQAAADGRHADVWINDQIGFDWWSGDGTTASAFINAVAALGEVETLTVHINSPGGDVADGIAIANYLRGHKALVTTRVEGIAASIAATIAMGGDRREMATGSLLMIHDPWTVAMGNASEMRKLADDLDTIRNGILELFVARAGEPRREEIQQAMSAETWMTGAEAVALGLVDAVEADIKAAASIGDYSRALAAAGRSAQQHIDQQKAPAPSAMSAADALALAFDLSVEQAEAQAAELGDRIVALRQREDSSADGDPVALVASSLQLDAEQVRATPNIALDAINALRTQAASASPAALEQHLQGERTRVTAIVKACQTTGQTSLMEKLIGNGMAEAQASEYIYDVAAASGHGIHNSHSPEGGHKAGIDHNKIYARRNRSNQA